MKIKIEDRKYTVVETLPYHGIGLPTKIIINENGKKITVVKRAGKWRFWTFTDMIGR